MWARTHRCPCCEGAGLPIYRALCAFCMVQVPCGLSSDFIYAYRLRVQEPVIYYDSLARLYIWRNETNAGLFKDGDW